jgi:hypothetical protein
MRTTLIISVALALVMSGGCGAANYSGTFKNEELTVTLDGDKGQYSGAIEMGERKFPLTASEKDGKLEGSFESQGRNFDFTATLNGQTMTLVSGGTTYVLKKQTVTAAANLPGRPPATFAQGTPPPPPPKAVPPLDLSKIKWEQYTSKKNLFIVKKPAGWKVSETLDERAGAWSCTITDPERGWLASINHGISPFGRDVNKIANQIVDAMMKAVSNFQLAPTAKVKDTERKRLILFEGGWIDPRGGKRKFRCMVSGGDGMMLHEKIEAPEDQFQQAAPVLLQTLANFCVANIFTSGGGGGGGARPAPKLVQHQLPSGWAKYNAPADWNAQEIGKGQCIIMDPSKKQFFIAANASFVTPRYMVRGAPGVLCSELLTPHEALAFAMTQQGHGSNFRWVFVKKRTDMEQTARTFAGPLRPVAVEDFEYRFLDRNGKPFTGFTNGGCQADAMRAGWGLWHFTIMAPTDEFENDLPTLRAVMSSYELNGQMVGQQMAKNMENYYAGLRKLSNQIAMNSEQMRRENLQLFEERGRSQDYIRYQTTRMIMEDYHYLARDTGYVVANQDGLFTPDGQRIYSVETPEGRRYSATGPYGEPATQHMQEINSRELFEQTFRR